MGVSGALDILVSDQAVLHWQDFSIDAKETVHFLQPSVDAVVLNRVIGLRVSHILGTLEANGKILLINPNGVLFGKEARIDVGSLIASTLDVKNQSFLDNNTFVFDGDPRQGICNQGSLHASQGDSSSSAIPLSMKACSVPIRAL